MRARRRTRTLVADCRRPLSALVAGPLSAVRASSQTTRHRHRRKNPLAGNGMWIWYLNRSSHGKLGAIAAKAHARRIETVLIKSGDGTHYWSQFSPALVSRLHARGPERLRLAVRLRAQPRQGGARGRGRGREGRRLPGDRRRGPVRGPLRAGVDLHDTLRSLRRARTTRSGSPASPTSTTTRPCPTRSSSARVAPSTTCRSSTGRTSAPPSTRAHPHLGLEPDLRAADRSRSGQVYSHPKAGQIRASGPGDVARLRRRQLVGLAVGRQAPVEGGGSAGLPGGHHAVPELPVPSLGSKGDFVAWAQQLLAGGGYTVPINGYFQGSDPVGRLRLPEPLTACRRPATSTSPPGARCCRTTRCRPLDDRRRRGRPQARAASALPPPKLGEAARRCGTRSRRRPAEAQSRHGSRTSSGLRSCERPCVRRGAGAAAEGQHPDLAVPDRDGRR